jgi:ABC-type multidrug transport system fused ATPase/permease subunit
VQVVLIAVRVLAFIAGAYVVYSTVMSAIVTFVLPRAAQTRISRVVFIAVRNALDIVAPRNSEYHKRDRVFAMQAPISLISLPIVWLLLVLGGFTLMYWAVIFDIREAFITSGSSMLTLGFARPERLPTIALTFVQAAMGLGLVALLISYLPTIYAGFSRRETQVALLEAIAGSPPNPVDLLSRADRIGYTDRLEEVWRAWQEWFADIEESHTSLVAVVFFRSPDPDRSWVTAAGCILDSAALMTSLVDAPRSPDAQLCIRAGFVSLRRITDFFGYPHDPDPKPDDPISITREEFDSVSQQLAAAGVPLRPDRDQAWRDFRGWRVNYDTVLRFLAGVTTAPPHQWSGDRAIPFRAPPFWLAWRLTQRRHQHRERRSD